MEQPRASKFKLSALVEENLRQIQLVLDETADSLESVKNLSNDYPPGRRSQNFLWQLSCSATQLDILNRQAGGTGTPNKDALLQSIGQKRTRTEENLARKSSPLDRFTRQQQVVLYKEFTGNLALPPALWKQTIRTSPSSLNRFDKIIEDTKDAGWLDSQIGALIAVVASDEANMVVQEASKRLTDYVKSAIGRQLALEPTWSYCLAPPNRPTPVSCVVLADVLGLLIPRRLKQMIITDIPEAQKALLAIACFPEKTLAERKTRECLIKMARTQNWDGIRNVIETIDRPQWYELPLSIRENYPQAVMLRSDQEIDLILSNRKHFENPYGKFFLDKENGHILQIRFSDGTEKIQFNDIKVDTRLGKSTGNGVCLPIAALKKREMDAKQFFRQLDNGKIIPLSTRSYPELPTIVYVSHENHSPRGVETTAEQALTIQEIMSPSRGNGGGPGTLALGARS